MEDRGYLALALFDTLRAAGVGYCVLGDAYGYPHQIPSDIDIAVEPQDLRRVPGVLAAFCREYDLQIVQWLRHEHAAWYFVLAWRDDVGRPRYIAVDFCDDWRRGGMIFLNSRELMGRRREALDAGALPKGFDVPAPDVQFIYYLLKKVDKLELDAVQGECLARLWREDSAQARHQIERFWADPGDVRRLAYAAESNAWDGVRAQLPRLREAMRRNLSRPLRAYVLEARRILERVLRPSGFVVALIGPDGCGKSTVLRYVADGMAPAFRRTRVLHLRPRLIPWPQPGAGARADRPHALPPRGRFLSLLKLAWFVADALLGYALRIRPFMVRSGLVLYDRDLRDMLVDPRRYRMNLPRPLMRLGLRLLPQPDLWVLLDAPANVLQARKGEVPYLESERQRRAFQDLVRGFRDAVEVDASRPPDVVAADVEAAILRWLEFRLERRHPRWFVGSNPLAANLLLFVSRHRVPLLGKLVRLLLNSDVYCRVRAPILMPHPYGIVVHSKAQIGSRVTIMQQVTLGGKDPHVDEAPVIEDNVYIGAGAKVLGGVRVGRGAVIGANAVVTRDVLSHCRVVGANRVLKQRRPGPRVCSAYPDPRRHARHRAHAAWNASA